MKQPFRLLLILAILVLARGAGTGSVAAQGDDSQPLTIGDSCPGHIY